MLHGQTAEKVENGVDFSALNSTKKSFPKNMKHHNEKTSHAVLRQQGQLVVRSTIGRFQLYAHQVVS